MSDYPPILTVAEGAALMRVSKDKMFEWIYGGRVPCIRDGRVFRLSREKLLEVAASGLLEGEPVERVRVQRRR